METCKICNQDFSLDKDFNKHLKSHKLSQCEYYQTYYKRVDRYDGSLIKFKNKDFYFSTDFNSKITLKKWLKTADKEDIKTYLVSYLTNRKQKKGLTYTPTQVELKTLPICGIKYFNEIFDDYYKLCETLGFKNRFNKYLLNKKKFTDISRKMILTDSREQNALEFDNRQKVKGLKFGDYAMRGSDIVIERKSLSDFWGTLTGGYERFCREIQRAKDSDSYLVVVVEEPLTEVYGFPFRWQVRGKIKISPEVPLHNVR